MTIGTNSKISSTTPYGPGTSPDFNDAYQQKYELAAAARSNKFQSNSDSFGSLDSLENSITDIDELSKFFVSSIDEIEDLLRSSDHNSSSCGYQLDLQHQHLHQQQQSQQQHGNGTNRMKYAMNF